jgi:DNA (cytosine-5)-methyltransferase 1
MGAAYTPETWDAWTDRMRAEHGNGNGHGKSLNIEALRLLPSPRTSDTNGSGAHGSLLPTPRATDGTKGGPNQRGSSGDLMLPSAVQRMVPTPTVGDSKSARNSTATRHALPPTGLHAGDTLTDAFVPVAGEEASQDWREYEAAIRRQEQAFGRPAPLPTEPGNKGQPRLSPRFVEWLMGLPEGWVTDVPGISRNDQLKALGNGVVPPQAAAATRAFLQDTMTEARTA